MGLSNTGTETIRVDAEIIPELSPFVTDGTYAGYSNNDTITDLRYLSFNTKTSKLWNAFVLNFTDDIKAAYRLLRNSGIYSVASIMKNALALTSDQIGEIYYNKDAASKYLSQTNESNSEYLKMLHGNRVQKFKQFLTQRMTFLDTIFGYMESETQTDTLNSIITLRSDALYGNTSSGTIESLKCYLGISVYTPQYVTINVGSGRDAIVTAYVSPESTYIDPDTGAEEEGTLFSFPIKGTDKEMIISGAGNIKQIKKLEDLNVRDLTITKAEKIVQLNLSSSSRMTALTLGNNKYLRELDCSNSYLLGTGTNGQLLNLSQCVNLRKVDASWTKFTAINFPKNANLQEIKLNGSTIKSVDIDGMEFLKNISIENCTDMTNFTINKCPKITVVDIANSTVKNFAATNCEALTDVNVSGCKSMTGFDLTNSDKISTINMASNTSPILNDLHLYTLYNLTNLTITNTTSLNTIRFPKYANAAEAAKAAQGQPAELWHGLRRLDLTNSSIVKIQYGSADTSNNYCDMSQLTNLDYLTFNGCTVVEDIENLNYSTTNGLVNLFNTCEMLRRISGTLTTSGSDISNIFFRCKKLNDINDLTFNFTGVINATSAFNRCHSMTTSMLKKLLDACGASLDRITSICTMQDTSNAVIGTAADRPGRDIPSNLFENTPNIIYMDGAFDLTNYTTIPGDLLNPVANKIHDLRGAFGRMGSLTTVGKDLLKNKPNLVYLYAAFAYDENLRYFINEDPNIFEGSPNIYGTDQMFLNCGQLITGDNGFGKMFDPMINLNYCQYMFAGCGNLTAPIPDGLLSKNTKLIKIDGLFLNCGRLPSLPNSLFRKSITDSSTFPDLTLARNVFSGCSSMTGVVSSHFFNGANNLTDIGAYANDQMYASGAWFSGGGFFSNTNITGYYETFLQSLPNLTRCNGLFNHDNGNSSLRYCYYYSNGSNVVEYNGSISEKLFINNKYLQDVSTIFRNNTGLLGHIPADLFKSCKGSLMFAEHAFSGCTSLTGNNLDNEDSSISNAVGISDQWFNGARNLISVAYFLYSCTNFTGSIPKDLFKDCVSLQNVSGFVRGCSNINGEIPIELFNYCRNTLRYTNEMFMDCINITGKFPTGTYSTATGVVGYEVCNSSDEGALQVVDVVTDYSTQVEFAVVVEMSPGLSSIITNNGRYYVKATLGEITTIVQAGLLAECLNLENTSHMFSNCMKLGIGSGVPNDIFFTSNVTKKFTKLKYTYWMFYRCGFDQAYIDPNTKIAYLCDSNLLVKCPALEDISHMFRSLERMPECNLYMNMFDKQSALVSCTYVFYNIRRLTGSVTQALLRNSLGTLRYADKMFAFTNITNVNGAFLHGDTTNKKLEHVGAIFYGCSNIRGTSPQFWNPDHFSAIALTEIGYHGALHTCTGLSNYSDANNNSTNWTKSLPLYTP